MRSFDYSAISGVKFHVIFEFSIPVICKDANTNTFIHTKATSTRHDNQADKLRLQMPLSSSTFGRKVITGNGFSDPDFL